ncbi:MAG: cell division topological specificity factor MinE [Desulfobacteraceae bacterium 4572_130]|nr:MAG: cell division topological specificity factor MinE [Desulfobacteraceae bacterium 4572_130]
MLKELIKKLIGHKSSKNTAKKRLQFTLVYDKLEMNDNILNELQSDIINVISRYFKIDKKSLGLKVKHDKNMSALVFNTPILCVKREKA